MNNTNARQLFSIPAVGSLLEKIEDVTRKGLDFFHSVSSIILGAFVASSVLDIDTFCYNVGCSRDDTLHISTTAVFLNILGAVEFFIYLQSSLLEVWH